MKVKFKERKLFHSFIFHIFLLDTIGFLSESQLLQYVKKNDNYNLMAIVFNGNVKETPKKLNYDIRIHEPYIDWKIDQRFVKTHGYAPDQGLLLLLHPVIVVAFF